LTLKRTGLASIATDVGSEMLRGALLVAGSNGTGRKFFANF
jgi:hypothetical protein